MLVLAINIMFNHNTTETTDERHDPEDSTLTKNAEGVIPQLAEAQTQRAVVEQN